MLYAKMVLIPFYLADDLLYYTRLLTATAVTSGLLTLQLWWLGLPDARRSCLEQSSTSRQGCAITSVGPELPEDMSRGIGESWLTP